MTTIQIKIPNWLDRIDYYRLGHLKWHLKGCDMKKFYAVRDVKTGPGRTRQLSLHREIMNEPKGLLVDHKNSDSLDNRIANLRPATRAENAQNRKKTQNASSKYKGVSFHKRYKKWSVNISHKGKNMLLGYFENEIDAAKTYDRAALKYYGQFAKLNFPKEIERSPKPREIQRISETKVLGIPKHRDSRGRLNLRLVNWLGARTNFSAEPKPALKA
jgi:membrane-bound lytic murein transglycosylase